MHARPTARRGFSLIELTIVIVVLGIAATALMAASGRSSVQSAQMLREQQMLYVANAMLAEVKAAPFTFCDPDKDGTWRNDTVLSPADCATQEAAGPEAGQTRFGSPALGLRFDNVTDYNGYVMPGPDCSSLCGADGLPIPAGPESMAGCSAAVAVTAAGMGGIAALDTTGRPQSVLVSVTVLCPGVAAPVVLQAFRLRHAPKSA